jgi:hypothetical protein
VLFFVFRQPHFALFSFHGVWRAGMTSADMRPQWSKLRMPSTCCCISGCKVRCEERLGRGIASEGAIVNAE